MPKEKTTKEKLIEEFEKKYSSFELCNQISKPELDKLKNFLSQAIDQTREETIRYILKLMPTIYEETSMTRYDFLITLEDKLKSLINKPTTKSGNK